MSRLLIISSNPRRDLNLDREISDLNNALQRLGMFKIILGLGVPAQEISGLIADHIPQIVHFCGHGAGKRGLFFQDEEGKEQLVSTEILARIFKTFASEINCTVLNACDTVPQAKAIVEYINYAIGMNQPILDKAAYHFSVGFYKGLGAEKSIEQAYEMGCIAIQIWSETNSQSRKDRKLEYAGDIVEPASSSLKEYEKPVLLKKTSNSVREVHTPSALPDRSSEFVEFVKQEIDRQEYKDFAREAYDNFGQFSVQNATNLTKSDYKQRKILLDKVKQFWIEGFLKPSLQGSAALSLGVIARPEATADLTQGIEALLVELDPSYERLRATQIYDEIGRGRTLLILGSPGAGKTIALLQLAQRLISRSEENLALPIPVVFNLSSWARRRRPIYDWLIDELQEKYQVPALLSEPWFKQQQLILLLDGLDEVDEDYRNKCVSNINDFISLFPQIEVAICCRVSDYESLTERLMISSALCLQPLTLKQVYGVLDDVGDSTIGLKKLLKNDTDLEEFARTPLILNFMKEAYAGYSVEKLIPQLKDNPNRAQNLFHTYIGRRLDRGATSTFTYPRERVMRWLSWLANRMEQNKHTIFLIERMQPNWLQDREEKAYPIFTVILVGLISGINCSLVGWLTTLLIPTQHSWIDRAPLIFGVAAVIVSGIVTMLPQRALTLEQLKWLWTKDKSRSEILQQEIFPLDQLNWSWARAKSRWVSELSFGIVFGVILGLILWTISNFKDIQGLRFGSILGLIFGLLFVLGCGLGHSKIKHQAYPNQGIYSSVKNSIIIGLIGAIISGIIFMLIGEAQISMLFAGAGKIVVGVIGGIIFGLIFGLKYGGVAWNQHLVLRLILHQKGRIPWNYAKLLDFASERLLMKKVGGGYVFFHRMLLEHFARMNPN